MDSVRLQGLWQIGIGLTAIVMVFALGNWYFGEGNWTLIGWGAGLPGAVVLVGLIQFISGVPFYKLSRKWDSLKGWQRGILGTLIFIFSTAFILGGFVLYLLSTGT